MKNLTLLLISLALWGCGNSSEKNAKGGSNHKETTEIKLLLEQTENLEWKSIAQIVASSKNLRTQQSLAELANELDQNLNIYCYDTCVVEKKDKSYEIK